MGLDIHIGADNYDDVYPIEYYTNEKEFRLKMSLSREFCNLMCRRHVAEGIPELNQIGKLVNVDISPVYQMDRYWDVESADQKISLGETKKDREKIARQIEADNDSVKNNIGIILETVSSLIEKLAEVGGLEKEIIAHGSDTIGVDYYFSDFNTDKGEGYLDNNFGQDLRNFKRFLEYAKAKGTTMVYFSYS